MGKLPFNFAEVAAQDAVADGTYRFRIVALETRPRGVELGPNGEQEGKFNEEGQQVYGLLNIGFRFTDHEANVAVNPKTGKAMSLAGKTLWDGFSLNPVSRRAKLISDLYTRTGTSPEADYQELKGKEVDGVVRNMQTQEARKEYPDDRDKGDKEPKIIGFRTPLG